MKATVNSLEKEKLSEGLASALLGFQVSALTRQGAQKRTGERVKKGTC